MSIHTQSKNIDVNVTVGRDHILHRLRPMVLFGCLSTKPYPLVLPEPLMVHSPATFLLLGLIPQSTT